MATEIGYHPAGTPPASTGLGPYIMAIRRAQCLSDYLAISSISLYMGDGNTAGYKLTAALYSDVAGEPGTKLATCEEVVLTATPGWVTANVSGSSPVLTNGDWYWICARTYGGNVFFGTDQTDNQNMHYGSSGTYPTLPTTFPTHNHLVGYTWWAYATLDVPPLTAGTLTLGIAIGGDVTITATMGAGGTPPYTYQLQRATDTGDFSDIGAPQSDLTWTDSTCVTVTRYLYRVVVTDSVDETATGDSAAITYGCSQVAPYDSAEASLTAGISGANYRYVFVYGQQYRIRQTGTILAVRTTINSAVTEYRVQIWRKNAQDMFEIVAQTEDISASLSVGVVSFVKLVTPLTDIMEGDYYGCCSWGGGANTIGCRTGITGSTLYYVQSATLLTGTYDWLSKPSLSGTPVPIEFYCATTDVIFIGDSIFAGHISHYSFLETTATTNIGSTIESQYAALTGETYQNMGIGSQTTTQIEARFATDVVALRPDKVIIEGGVNDVFIGSIQEGELPDPADGTFLGNWKSMLDQADAAGIAAVVLKILPWTDGSDANMQKVDFWNADLATLVAGYDNAEIVDADSYVGQFREGGDPGNLWDIQPDYTSDGVHYTASGHGQIAQALADLVLESSSTIVVFSSSSSSLSTASYSTSSSSTSVMEEGRWAVERMDVMVAGAEEAQFMIAGAEA